MSAPAMVAASLLFASCSVSHAARLHTSSPERAIHALQRGTQVAGETTPRWTLSERMKHYKTPGVSVAIIDEGRVVWAAGFGVKEVEGAGPVDSTTLFQAASISKVAAALGTMHLVEHNVLSLDGNVNDALVSWKVPDNEFTAREKVTLRRIMSHTAGLTVHGFDGFQPGMSLPTLPEVLDGTPPAKNPAVRVFAIPGTVARYSGGGATVMQLLVTETVGSTFASFMRETVLEPLNMMRSTFDQPLPPAREASAAAGHDSEGAVIPGKRHVYPMQAAAGLWTTPSDLAQIIIEVQQTHEGGGEHVVRLGTLQTMLTPGMGEYGLGFGVEQQHPGLTRFFHNGGNDGFRATMTGYVERGQGAVVMINGENQELLFEILRGIADEYGWPDRFIKTINPFHLSAEQIARVAGDYRLEENTEVVVHVIAEGGDLYVQAGGDARQRIVPTSATTFIPLEGELDVRAELERDGSVQRILLRGGAHGARRIQ